MVIDAKHEDANVVISRLRAEARRTREPRIVTVLSRSMAIVTCAVAWAQVMGHTATVLDERAPTFQIRLMPGR